MKIIKENVHGFKAFRQFADEEEQIPLLEDHYFAEKLTDCFKWYICDENIPLEDIKVVELVTDKAEVLPNTHGELGNLYIGHNNQYMHVLSREELLSLVRTLSPLEILEFVKKVRLTEEELLLFFHIDSAIDKAIQYYQRNDKLVYTRRFENKTL